MADFLQYLFICFVLSFGLIVKPREYIRRSKDAYRRARYYSMAGWICRITGTPGICLVLIRGLSAKRAILPEVAEGWLLYFQGYDFGFFVGTVLVGWLLFYLQGDDGGEENEEDDDDDDRPGRGRFVLDLVRI